LFDAEHDVSTLQSPQKNRVNKSGISFACNFFLLKLQISIPGKEKGSIRNFPEFHSFPPLCSALLFLPSLSVQFPVTTLQSFVRGHKESGQKIE
jgi:hypothetical protein